MHDKSDATLMKLACNGDNDAFGEIVRRYQTDVFRFCMHYLSNAEAAKDAAQDVFLRLYSYRERFDTGKKFKPWLLSIARNHCLNEIRRSRTVPFFSLDELTGSGVETKDGDGARPDGAILKTEEVSALRRAMNGLPPDDQELIIMRYFDALAVKEIAEVTGKKESAIRVRIHRLLKRLHEDINSQVI